MRTSKTHVWAALVAAVLAIAPGVAGAASTQPPATLQSLGAAPLGAPYKQPTIFDDALHGNYPGMVYRSNGAQWVAQSNAVGAAVWQRQEQMSLPGDAIGLYVSAATVASAGSGYTTGDTATLQGGVVLTVTASGGAVSSVAITKPNMYGVCSPTLSAAPALLTSGTGTGLTVNLTLLYPTIYAVRRVSSCYTGSILRVTNTATKQTKDIGYLTDNGLDLSTALSFGSGGSQVEQYAYYTDGAYPAVAIWYDQGGNPAPNNASQTIVAQQPALFAGRKMGNSVPILFPSQYAGGCAASICQASTSLSLPSSLTISSANATLIVGGGDIDYQSPLVALTPVSGMAGAVFGLTDTSGYPTCNNQNTAGSGSVNGNAAPVITETPAVYSCMWTAGNLLVDSTYFPTPSIDYGLFAFASASTQSITVNPSGTNGSTNCPIAGAHTLSLQAGSSEIYPVYLSRLVAAINADPVFQADGISARVSLFNNRSGAYILSIYQPVSAGCVFTTSTVGSGGFSSARNNGNQPNGAGWNFAGGTLGANGSVSGMSYEGFVAIVPWAMPPAQVQQVRQAVHFHYAIDGHIGAVVSMLIASNMQGENTPFLQDVGAEILRLLGRDDIVIINKSQAGASWISSASSFVASGNFGNPLFYMTSGKLTNNIAILAGEYNSLTATGNGTLEYNSIQSVASAHLSTGWQTICFGEINKGVTSLAISENLIMQGLLNTNPGSCTATINPQSIGVYSIPYPGPWPWPIFGKAGGHVSQQGNAPLESMIAEQIRVMLH